MNLRTIGLSTVAATAVATVSLVSAPAQAASFTSIDVDSTLNIRQTNNGGVRSNISGNTLNLNFSSNNNGTGQGFRIWNSGALASTGSFEDARENSPTPVGAIQDLTLQLVSGTQYRLAAPVTTFLSGIDLKDTPGAPGLANIAFTLTHFNYNASTGDAGYVLGYFTTNAGDYLRWARGTFTSSLNATSNNRVDYDLSLTAVPTPALLPGLIGLGMGVVRKRKQAAEQEADA